MMDHAPSPVIEVVVNGRLMEFEVDTGSDICLIRFEDAQRLKLRMPFVDMIVHGRMFRNHECDIATRPDPDMPRSLLGMDVISRFDVTIDHGRATFK